MAFKRWNRSPSKKAPTRSWTEDEMKIVGYCLSKGVGIGVSPDWKDELNNWQIEITINKKVHIDPKRYDDNVLDKVMEYYKYYYNKHKLNTDNNR
jgi:hypothetical protein